MRTKRNLRSGSQFRRQQGAVLAFALVFLIVLTVIAVANMETTILEERMAGNMQDYNMALQAAESALEVAEDWLADQILLPATSNNGTTTVWRVDSPDPDADTDPWWAERDAAWWNTNGLGVAGLNGLAAQPRYLIEEIFVSVQGQSVVQGTGDPPPQRIYHRVSARGVGGNANTEVMLQTTYVRPYD